MSLAQTADDGAILETREVSPTHFLVKVESFSLLGLDGTHKYETGEFGAGGYTWRLIIYPNEDKTGTDSDYLSLYLALSDTTSLPANWEVTAVFSFFVFNQISCNYLYSLGRTRRFLAMKLEWGFSKFVSKKVLMDPSNGFLIGNNCVFGAEVFIVEKSAVLDCLALTKVNVPYRHYKRDWKISNLSKLAEIWTSEQFVVEGLNWEVYLKPTGKGSDGRCYLAAYLRLINSERVKAWFSICIKDQINNENDIKRTYTANWFPSSNNWGWRDFIDVPTLEDPRNGFIVKDCCLLEIEISIHSIA